MIRPLSILVVDDSPEDRLLLMRMFNSAGISHEVSECGTAKEGIALINRGGFDCVYVDGMLPDSCGATLIEYIAGLDPSISVVGITSSSSDHVVNMMISSGAAMVIDKGSASDALVKNSMHIAMRRTSHLKETKRLGVNIPALRSNTWDTLRDRLVSVLEEGGKKHGC